MPKPRPSRFSIDFSLDDDLNDVIKFPDLYKIIEQTVLPEIKVKAELEKKGITKKNGREQHLSYWWKFWRRREDMINAISNLPRYISCSRVSKRPIFEFVCSNIRPNDALMVFAFDDDYSFGIIQSTYHILWYQEKCSTMKGDPRYTTESIWDTFPWPQKPTGRQITSIAGIAKKLRKERHKIMIESNTTLRNIYNNLEKPGKNIIREIHEELDVAVAEAYGFSSRKDSLEQLLELNFIIAERESKKEFVQRPGLPQFVKDREIFISEDCVGYVDLPN
jgi:hypothetical protein